MNEENKTEEVFQCICGKQFDNKTSLRCHKSNCKIYQESVKDQKLKIQQEKEFKRLPNGMFKCENPDCGKEHDGSYGSGRFCCIECRRHYNSKIGNQTAVKNGTKYRSKNFGKSQAPYGTWKCSICGEIFETRAKLIEHKHQFHPIPKGQVWNKNLSRAIDNRVAKGARTLSMRYKSGYYVVHNKGIPKTEEQKQKIRIGFSNYLASLPVNAKVNYNKNSIPIIEQIGKKYGWNLQHAENGGEITVLGYWLDAYDKEKNIVVEYDEPAHYEDIDNNVLREKDLKRQREIIEHLSCEYWRYNEATQCLWKVEI